MFPGRIRKGKEAVVAEGLPSLLAEMDKAGINTPRRVAAFLATLQAESMFEYNIHQFGDTSTYAGRGYIQLTGAVNYTDAGHYLGIDLVGDPDLAMDLRYSAKIAIWYWTVARHINPFADALQMGKVNRAIGYPLSPPGTDGKTNDQRRCEAFQKALQYLTGSPAPEPVDCTR